MEPYYILCICYEHGKVLNQKKTVQVLFQSAFHFNPQNT